MYYITIHAISGQLDIEYQVSRYYISSGYDTSVLHEM